MNTLEQLCAQPVVLPAPATYGSAIHVVSNDESGQQYALAQQMREASRPIERGSMPAALVVGEAALAAALPYMDQQLIFVCDRNPDMVSYMTGYRDLLRITTAASPRWRDSIGTHATEHTQRFITCHDVTSRLRLQADAWNTVGLPHPYTDRDQLALSAECARNKQIIPYRIDLTNLDCMERLGRQLRVARVVLTLVNITNIMHAEQLSGKWTATLLSALPLAEDVHILATDPRVEPSPPVPITLLGSIGPFAGLDTLREHIGNPPRPTDC